MCGCGQRGTRGETDPLSTSGQWEIPSTSYMKPSPTLTPASVVDEQDAPYLDVPHTRPRFLAVEEGEPVRATLSDAGDTSYRWSALYIRGKPSAHAIDVTYDSDCNTDVMIATFALGGQPGRSVYAAVEAREAAAACAATAANAKRDAA